MKINDPNITKFPIQFNSDNTFILQKDIDHHSRILSLIEDIDSKDKTVVITDDYLFPSNYNNDYKDTLLEVLKKFNASKIIICCKSRPSQNLFSEIQRDLSSSYCELTYFLTSDYHDRYWVCIDNEKGFYIGTSLNGVGSKTSTIKLLDNEEIKELKNSFSLAGII